MATEFRNDTATPVGLWDADTVHHVVAPFGGAVTLEPSQGAQETIDILVSAGAGAVSEVFAPENVAPPSITGTANVGETLTGDDGQWSGTPAPTLTRRWNRDGSAISGATGTTYDLVEDDEGAEITLTVTATNSAGSASETSVPVGPVEAALSAPVNSAVPTISGTPTVGQSLTSTTGTWTGNPSPTYSRQWLRGSTAISGATAASYTLVAADVGQAISVRVTATNSQGSAQATSAATDAVSGIAPVNTVAPALSGTPIVGETLTVTNGTWTGTPAPTYAREWLRDGSAISGATGTTYVLTEDDVDASITVRVTGTNSAGNAQAVSNAIGPVVAAEPEEP